MLGIVCLGRNSSNQEKKQVITSFINIGPTMVGFILLGIFIDNQYFNNGIPVIIGVTLGIINMIAVLIKVVLINDNDGEDNKE